MSFIDKPYSPNPHFDTVKIGASPIADRILSIHMTNAFGASPFFQNSTANGSTWMYFGQSFVGGRCGSLVFQDNDDAATGYVSVGCYGDAASAGLCCQKGGNVGIGLVAPKTQLTVEGALTLKEQNAADGDTDAYGQFWVKDDAPNVPMFTGDDGVDHQLAFVP